MRFLPVADDALLVEMASQGEVLALFANLQSSPLVGMSDIIPAARTLLIRFEPQSTSAQRLARHIVHYPPSEHARQSRGRINIPVHYNGEDLAEVADMLGISTEEVIRRHTDCEYTVVFTGFAPGFAYLSGNCGLVVPRRRSPRPRIPAGAVGLAGEYCGIYPRSSPGGWQIIGSTPLPMWEITRDVPATLCPGMAVSFHRSNSRIYPVSTSDPLPPPPGLPVLKVISRGLQMLFQDDGRRGYSALGVSTSGAADRGALHSANRIVGNAPDEACLEFIPGGVTLVVQQDGLAAVTGSECAITLSTAGGDCHTLPTWQPLDIRAGDELTFGPAIRGCRCYLSLRNGFAVSAVLRSCASDTLGGIGPAAVQNGDVINGKSTRTSLPVSESETPVHPLPTAGETVTLDVNMGPRTDWFIHEAIAQFCQKNWLVTSLSDRTGLRLKADVPLARTETRELSSEGLLPGAIQVPPDGNPILFLTDAPVTGGYPVIGYVADHHLDLAGQLASGVHIRFNPLTPFMPLIPDTPTKETE
ncbi:TPA: carboxyltransferase domain-containing protein [Klebsiella aerogenes]|nr:carboxyltransferase domain-containing protein [Klebsiella aerogenes]